jgi:Spy/CpxP family protein refolding chaperone
MDFFRKNKIAGAIIIILVALNLVLLGLFWLRDFRHPEFSFRDRPGEERPERIMGFFRHELDLNQEQVGQFSEQRRLFFDEMKPIMKQIHELRVELTDAIFSDQPDENMVRSLITQISELEQKRELAMFNHIGQVRALCTPEQRLKLKDLMRDVMMHNRPDMRSDRMDRRPDKHSRRP